MREITEAGAAQRGVRLTLPLSCRVGTSQVMLEPAHCEWLFRTAAYGAVRDGLLGMGEDAFCCLLPGVVRERHPSVLCLASLVLELRDARGRVVSRTDVPAEAFAPFVEARAARLWVQTGQETTDAPLGRLDFSLHAGPEVEEPFPVTVPRLPAVSFGTLDLTSTVGEPDRDWVATVISPAVVEGFDALEAVSRAHGVESAGRIHGHLGFDPDRRCFVRLLERLVVTKQTEASATAVVSSAASWGEFLGSVPGDGPTAASHVHTHLHLRRTETAPGSADQAGLDPTAGPIISIDDRITHLVNYPDTLSASLVLSLYEDRRVLNVYGYAADGRLREEPGWFLSDTSASHDSSRHPMKEVHP